MPYHLKDVYYSLITKPIKLDLASPPLLLGLPPLPSLNAIQPYAFRVSSFNLIYIVVIAALIVSSKIMTICFKIKAEAWKMW